MNNSTNKNEEIFLLDLQLISSIIFIVASIISVIITYNEKLDATNRKKLFTTKQSLNISYYNRIVILVVVIVSLYVGYKNFSSEDKGIAKYKSGLLLSTNVLTLISAIIILYVSYLNKEEQSLTTSDVENPLI